MWITISVFIVLLFIFLFEYRIRRPDQIVLHEARGVVKRRKLRFYPRHFSLCISGSVYSLLQVVEAEAKGHLVQKIKIAITVVPSLDNLPALIRVGGWSAETVAQAAKELIVKMDSSVREFSGKHAVEEFSSELLAKRLMERLGDNEKTLGLEIISVNVLSAEPVDEKISEAMRQSEAARILEQTEITNQKARVAVAKAKRDADEKIAQLEHELELKKIELKQISEEKEAQLSRLRVEEELFLKTKQMEVDQKEIELLTKNPEVLMLTPQLARLAEASQSLRNARTIVSLSGHEMKEGEQLIGLFKNLLLNLMTSIEKKGEIINK